MRFWAIVAAVAVSLGGFPGGPAASENGLQVEAGAFYRDSNRHEPDWSGQQLLLRGSPAEGLTTQLELVTSNRGGDSGQLGTVAAWLDLTDHVFVFGSAGLSHSASYFADRRGDAELHVKLPGFERMVVFGGGGRAEFEDADVRMWSAGTTLYFDDLIPGSSLAYRFTHFDNDLDRSSLRGTDGEGRQHLVTLLLGHERQGWGQLELRYLQGRDFLSDFYAAVGTNERFRTHIGGAAWRKQWTSRVGTHLRFEWEKTRDLYYRKSVEARLIWYF